MVVSKINIQNISINLTDYNMYINKTINILLNLLRYKTNEISSEELLDIVNELITDLLTNKKKKIFQCEEHFFNYIRKAAYHNAIHYCKQKNKQILLDEVIDSKLSIEIWDCNNNSHEHSKIELIKNLLLQFNKTERTIIQLHDFEGKSYKSIVEQLDISEANVRQIRHRTIEKLKNMISEQKK